MKNKLKKFEEDKDVQFFVIRSFITAAFETEYKKAEYHIMYIKKNSVPDAYYLGYKDLKSRRMNRLEVEHFKKNIDLYTDNVSYSKEKDIELGIVYNLKTKPFDKEQCETYKQFSLNL